MPTARRQSEMALIRDTAVQKLRDLTIAVALAAAAGVALIAWVSAATVPGIADSSGLTGNAANSGGGQTNPENDVAFTQVPRQTTGSGPGIAVSGGSH